MTLVATVRPATCTYQNHRQSSNYAPIGIEAARVAHKITNSEPEEVNARALVSAVAWYTHQQRFPEIRAWGRPARGGDSMFRVFQCYMLEDCQRIRAVSAPLSRFPHVRCGREANTISKASGHLSFPCLARWFISGDLPTRQMRLG